MKNIVRTLAASAAVAAFAADVAAGDFNNGAGPYQGIKGSAATPVPAPIPIQENFHYYVRGDLGVAFAGRKPSISESGTVIGELDTLSPLATSSFAQAHTRDNLGIPGTLGLGMYLSPRWRMDLTVDANKKENITYGGGFSYTADRALPAPSTLTPGGIEVGSTVTGRYSDRISARSTAYMLNAYYDLRDRGRLTPYIGAGIGFVHHNATREVDIPGYFVTPPVGTACTVPICVAGATSNGEHSSRHFGLAGAVMLGASYALDTRWVLDFNYRAMYMQGFEMSTRSTGYFSAGTGSPTALQTQESRIKIGDTWDHQIRAGVRINIW